MNQHSCTQPSVSVVVPLYNKGPHIARTLTSVFAQECPPLEVIVVDDCSTDDGPEKVLAYGDPRIKLIRNPVNKGPGAARNAGLDVARGRYVTFLDADDEWYPHFLKATVACLEGSGSSAALVATAYAWHPPGRSNGDDFGGLTGEYEVEASTPLALFSKIESRIHPGFMVIRTDVARRWGGYYAINKCLLGEDQYFLLKLLLNERIFIIPEPCGVYHTEASGLFGRMLQPVPATEPCLTDPADLIAACPPSKRDLLERYLSEKALDRAMLLVKLGQRRPAKELVNRFAEKQGPYRKKALMIRAIACLSPLLPPIRRVWRRASGLGALFR